MKKVTSAETKGVTEMTDVPENKEVMESVAEAGTASAMADAETEAVKPKKARAAKKDKEEDKAAAKTAEKKEKEEIKKEEPKTAAKKTKEEVRPEVYIQIWDREAALADVVDRIKEQFKAEGHRAGTIKSLSIYMKPEEGAAYYVINNKHDGKVDLF